jgi:intein/homing endonuclease
MFGSILTALFQREWKYITRIRLVIGTKSNILKWALISGIRHSIQKIIGHGLRKLKKAQSNGTNQLKEGLFIRKQQEDIGQNISLRAVLFVIRPLFKKIGRIRETPVQTLAPRLTVIKTGIRKPVFNLTVEDTHSFFANGILVSNCDALRYGCYSHAMFGSSILRRL